MKKLYFALLLVSIYSCFTSVQAEGYKPLITGNYEQGHRVYDVEVGEEDYFFKESWIKWKQKLSTTSYYYLKLRYAENKYQRESFDNTTLDLSGNYTYQLFKPLRLKVELGLMDKEYALDANKNYLETGTSLELSYRPGKKDYFLWNVSYQLENYQLSDKTNGLMGISLRWERKLWSGLTIHSSYKHTNHNYFEATSSSDKERESISLGFEYQL